MLPSGLVRVVYEQQEKELLDRIEMKRKIAEARERDVEVNHKAPLKEQDRSFVQLLSEKIFSRPFQKTDDRNNTECPTPCFEQAR